MPIALSNLRCRTPVLACAALVVASACSDATAPRYVRSTFSASAGWSIVGHPVPSLQVDGHTIRVDGDLTTPVPCFKLSGLALTEGTALVIRVSARSSLSAGQVCNDMVMPWLYTVTVPSAPSGVRSIRVIEHVGKDRVVLDEPLTPP